MPLSNNDYVNNSEPKCSRCHILFKRQEIIIPKKLKGIDIFSIWMTLLLKDIYSAFSTEINCPFYHLTSSIYQIDKLKKKLLS